MATRYKLATQDRAETLTNKTLTSPVIANIVPGANFTVTQNGVNAIVSEETSATADTLHLKAGKIGIKGVTNPTYTISFPNAVGNTLGVEAEPAGTAGKQIVFQAGATTAGTANIAGGTVQFKAGAGTGSGASLCQFFTGTTEAAGNTTLQTVSVKMTLNGIGFLGIGTTTPTGKIHLAGAVSAANGSTNGILTRVDAATITDSSTATSGTVAHVAVHGYAVPTLAASNASVTYTNASTLYIAGPPTASGLTITNPWAIYVNSGLTRLGGGLQMASWIQFTTGSNLIYDNNANEYLKFTSAASAVNEVTISNAATATPPIIEATGNDTNITLQLKPKGTGVVQSTAPIRLKGYTVATLPAGTVGDTAYVTDATVVVAKGAAPVAGGTSVAVVFYDGTGWKGI